MCNNDLIGSVEGDRLSRLSDDVLHNIFCYISIKDAIKTSVLSSRWRYVWISLPYLNFENLDRWSSISKFISNVLFHRNNQIQVSSVNLDLGKGVTDDESVGRIFNCAFSHKVQQLSVTRPPEDMFECMQIQSFVATPKWDLPALTTLHLDHVKLSNDNDKDSTGLFSKCTNLKNLTLKRCGLDGKRVFNICHPRLSDLTLEYTPRQRWEVVNVVTPQLKNLTIKRSQGNHLISAPGLTSLIMGNFQPWHFSSTPDGFHSLEKVRLFMYDPKKRADARTIVRLLQQLRSAKFLTLNLGILECLFSQSKVYQECLHLAALLEDEITLNNFMCVCVFVCVRIRTNDSRALDR